MKVIIAGISLIAIGALIMASALALNLVTPVYGNCYKTIDGKTCPLVGYELGGK